MNRLKELREKHKKTQQDLADYLNLTRKAISFYELGQRDIPNETLIRIADYFHTTTDEVLGHKPLPHLLGDPLLLGHHGDPTYEMAVKIYHAVLDSPEMRDIFAKILSLNKEE